MTSNPFYTQAVAAGWPIKETRGPTYMNPNDNNAVPQSAIDLGTAIATSINAYVNAGSPDITFGTFLTTYYATNPGSSAADRALVDFYFQSLFATSAAADVSELSVYYYAASTTTAAGAMSFANVVGPLAASNYFYVADGYGQRALAWLLSRLTSRTTIVNNAVVTGITLGTTGTTVNVITASQTYTAAYVICTVTLGNLKRGDITFTPALPPTYTAAIGRMGEKSFSSVDVTL